MHWLINYWSYRNYRSFKDNVHVLKHLKSRRIVFGSCRCQELRRIRWYVATISESLREAAWASFTPFTQEKFLQWPEWLHLQQNMFHIACFLVLWVNDQLTLRWLLNQISVSFYTLLSTGRPGYILFWKFMLYRSIWNWICYFHNSWCLHDLTIFVPNSSRLLFALLFRKFCELWLRDLLSWVLLSWGFWDSQTLFVRSYDNTERQEEPGQTLRSQAQYRMLTGPLIMWGKFEDNLCSVEAFTYSHASQTWCNNITADMFTTS